MDLAEPFLRAALTVVFVIALARINGLRSFSKMSSFDFVLTIAMGSLVASTIQDTSAPLSTGFAAIAAVFLTQAVIAVLRKRHARFRQATDNTPLLLMQGPRILHDNLRAGRITEEDLFSKLRAANVTRLEQVRAVVLETTGDVSVLHDEGPDRTLPEEVLQGVRRQA
jgi:uncharacterized membrane protein YcaP (DUF421 family)